MIRLEIDRRKHLSIHIYAVEQALVKEYKGTFYVISDFHLRNRHEGQNISKGIRIKNSSILIFYPKV